MKVIIEPILWVWKMCENGQYMIMIRLTQKKDVKYISTGYSSSTNDWNFENLEPLPSHPKYIAVTNKIKELREDAEFEVKLAGRNGELLTMAELKNRVVGKEEAPGQKKVLEFFDETINELEAAGRSGYADVFSNCKSTVYKLLNGKDKSFMAFTEKDFKAYEAFINSLKSENTKKNYLITFYRLWNMAIKAKHCSEKHHPKFFISYKAYKRVKTRKRAVPHDYITKIEELQFDYGTRLFRSQQCAIFTYYSRGINFTDLAKLKEGANVRKDSISYIRSKNKRQYDFRLHPKAKAVLDIFRAYPAQSDAGYVFPFLYKIHDNPRKIKERIKSALKDFNEDLTAFEGMIESPKHLTSYVLRHAFATNLRNKRVDIAIIKEAMGHETEEQTNTYLEEMDDTIIADSIELALQ